MFAVSYVENQLTRPDLLRYKIRHAVSSLQITPMKEDQHFTARMRIHISNDFFRRE